MKLWNHSLVVGLLVAGMCGASAGAQAPRKRKPSSSARSTFPTSAKPAAQAPFLTGVKALYNFEFDIAADAFREAQKADPDFALGYWGEAMSYNHPLWAQQDLPAARKVMERLAPTAAARAAKAPAGKERELIESIEVLFGAGDKLARDIAYADALKAMHAKYPGRRRDRLLLRAGAARHRHGRACRTRATRCRPRRSRGHLPAQPEAPGRGALHHPLVRRSRSRDPQPDRRARVLEDRAVGGARAAHAVAHLRPARDVGRRRRLERRGLQGRRRSGGGQEPAARPRGLPHALAGSSTRTCSRASSTRRRSASIRPRRSPTRTPRRTFATATRR